ADSARSSGGSLGHAPSDRAATLKLHVLHMCPGEGTMGTSGCSSALATLVVAFISTAGVSIAGKSVDLQPVDPTVTRPPLRYVRGPTDAAYFGMAAGDVAEADIQAVGGDLQYTGLVLNGDGSDRNAPYPFIKVQAQ